MILVHTLSCISIAVPGWCLSKVPDPADGTFSLATVPRNSLLVLQEALASAQALSYSIRAGWWLLCEGASAGSNAGQTPQSGSEQWSGFLKPASSLQGCKTSLAGRVAAPLYLARATRCQAAIRFFHYADCSQLLCRTLW